MPTPDSHLLIASINLLLRSATKLAIFEKDKTIYRIILRGGHKKYNEYPQRANVGAYRIRLNAPTYPRGCLQGVCDTPLQLIWQNVDIHKKRL